MIHNCETNDRCPRCPSKAKYEIKYKIVRLEKIPGNITVHIDPVRVDIHCGGCGLSQTSGIEPSGLNLG